MFAHAKLVQMANASSSIKTANVRKSYSITRL